MKNKIKLAFHLLLLGLFMSCNGFAESTPIAPGYSPLPFETPKVGSYSLPIIDSAADGEVITSKNQNRRLHDLMGDKVVLLSFIYSTCSDVNGCPLASIVFHKINKRLQQAPELVDKLRLLTLSFNPIDDTPEAMQHYADSFTDKRVDWEFLTTQSEQHIQPILDQYEQSIQKIVDEQGQYTGTYSHNLRVYLIDTNKQIRNIYSVSFLHADTLVNDVKTLLEEVVNSVETKPLNSPSQFQAGDNKQNYIDKNYQTQSIALNHRLGKRWDLQANLINPPLGLPPVPVPANNPITADKIALGRKLFYDRRLSLNNTFSCAMCHVPEQGFSSHEMATAVGIEGRSVRRNSPTIYNIAYANRLFHDGRETTLEQQIWAPLLASNEMGNPSIGYVIERIKSLPDYQGLFEQSFDAEANMLTVGQAIASYERSLVSADSPFDRWHFNQQADAVSESAKKGYQLFTGKGQCSGCHTIDASYAILTDNQFHNTGIGYLNSMGKASEQLKIQIAPGVFVEVDSENLASIAEESIGDLGRYEITQNPQDRWKYKTPSLRNIALTAPYMHNGTLSTLKEVVNFYNQGGVINKTLDPLIKPLNLSNTEIKDLVEFLNSLTGSNVSQLVSDAYAAPIGE